MAASGKCGKPAVEEKFRHFPLPQTSGLSGREKGHTRPASGEFAVLPPWGKGLYRGYFPCRAARRRGRKKPPRLCRGGLRVCWMQAQASLALAISVRAVNAALSLTASSASILRLISTPAFFRPFIKVE